MLKCITSEDEECILMNLICGKNLHQLMICLNTGYCITPRVLQFMVELGWTKEVKAFWRKVLSTILKTTKKGWLSG